jgi:hypothetical protein
MKIMKYTHTNPVKEIEDWLQKPKGVLINVTECEDHIELTFKEQTSYFSTSEMKVYKIIYSVIDGKLNKSEKIYGKIIPATEESYIF